MIKNSGNDGRRQRRAAENILGVLGEILLKNVSDPSLVGVTITDAEFSPDLRNAKIFYTTVNDTNLEKVTRGLERATPFLQREVGKKLQTRFTPKLVFKQDSSFERGFKIDKIIMENKHENQKVLQDETPEQSLARLVANVDNILLSGHANPDGDAIGSLLGMSRILRLMGKSPVTFCPDGIPDIFAFLYGSDEIVTKLDGEKFDLTIVMDTADEKMLPGGFPRVADRGIVAVIDHHMVHGKLGDIIIRRNVSAVGELIYQLTGELVWPIDQEVAQCLYTSIVADTGSFRYTSTTPDTHRVAANLLQLGADPWKSATALYESFSYNRQKLLGEVIDTLDVSEDGRYADLYCTMEMFERTKTTRKDLDGMINFGRSVDGVEIVALFSASQDGVVKVSFRSKGRVDVSQLAMKFGGGGHRNAAGAFIEDAQIEEAKDTVRAAARDHLRNTLATISENGN